MKRKPLPKAITRPIANLQKLAAGFAADEQGRVPRHTMTFDAVEPEPAQETGKPVEQPRRTELHQQTNAQVEAKIRPADPLAARRRALARRIAERHRNYAALGGLVPLPAANIASVTAVNLRMVKQLSELYGLPFERDRTRALIIALIAGAAPTGAGLAASSTLMWIVPGGLVWGLGAAALTAGALTRGIGAVFIESFETALSEERTQ
jgi:uncharacterized protein (DUF697 family)